MSNLNKKIDLLNEQKTEICTFNKNNPNIKQVELVAFFSKKFDRTIAKSTVSTILKNKDIYNN